MPKESEIQSKILTDLRSRAKNCECFKIMKASDNGEPDIFFTTKETGGVLIETKRPSGSLRKLQENKLEKLNKCGTPTFVCHSWEEWVEVKKKIGL